MEPEQPPEIAGPAIDVGAFEQGSPFSRWALARYVIGRVILERVSWTLLAGASVLLGLAAVSQFVLHVTVLTVLLIVIAVAVLLMRAVLRAVLRRLMSAAVYGPLEDRLHATLAGAGRDVLAELRRVGLPSHTLTLPLIAFRLAGRNRAATTSKLKQFEVERAVSRARLDELHLILRQASGAQPGAAR